MYVQDLERKDDTIAEVRRKGADDLARSKKDAQARATELRAKMRSQAAQLVELGEVPLGTTSRI